MVVYTGSLVIELPNSGHLATGHPQTLKAARSRSRLGIKSGDVLTMGHGKKSLALAPGDAPGRKWKPPRMSVKFSERNSNPELLGATSKCLGTDNLEIAKCHNKGSSFLLVWIRSKARYFRPSMFLFFLYGEDGGS